MEPVKKIMVRRNSMDGECYDVRLVRRGLFVCPICFHAYIGGCSNCGAKRPPQWVVDAQWGSAHVFGSCESCEDKGTTQ